MPDSRIDRHAFDELKQTVGDDFITELVSTFLEEAPPMLAQLRSALLAQDADAFRRTAHSLKTNANTFGALVLGKQAKALEHGGLPADDSGIKQIEQTYRETADAL